MLAVFFLHHVKDHNHQHQPQSSLIGELAGYHTLPRFLFNDWAGIMQIPLHHCTVLCVGSAMLDYTNMQIRRGALSDLHLHLKPSIVGTQIQA